MIALDTADVEKLNDFMQKLKALESSGILIGTITFKLYGEHRIRLARRGRSWWSPLRITKIEKVV